METNSNQISDIQNTNQSYKKYIASLEKIVFKAENLPQIIKLKGSKKQKFIILCGLDALEILNKFANLDIPVLPVHDSFIVDRDQANDLHKVMKETYEHYNGGHKCVIKGYNNDVM